MDAKSKKQSKKQVRELFMERNLYRDLINDENPTKIEEDFARYEDEVARIINERFVDKDEFILTQNENEKLKLFFALMSFRAKTTQELFKKGLSTDSKKIYSSWQKNYDFEDFWKRNLGKLVKCRSLEQVINSTEIDEPIKVFFIRDTHGFFGKYFCVAEPKDIGEFVLSDCYPVVLRGSCKTLYVGSCEVGVYDIFVISPQRVILFANAGCDSISRDLLGLRPLVVGKPVNKNNELIFRVKKLYLEEIETLNDLIIKHAKVGYIFRGEKRIFIK